MRLFVLDRHADAAAMCDGRRQLDELNEMLKARVNAINSQRILEQLAVRSGNESDSKTWSAGAASVLKLVAIPGEREFQLVQLVGLVDEFVALPSLSRFGDGFAGHKAWISVVDRGFVFHAYFGDDAIDFELYGPYEPGTEMTSCESSTGICGRIDSSCLKEALKLIENGESPVEFVSTSAIEVAKIEED